MTARITILTDSHRFAQQVARLNNKRGASSTIEALHASLSSLVTLMHIRIASGAAAEEDIFQRAGRIRQDLVKHEKVGLQFIFSPRIDAITNKAPIVTWFSMLNRTVYGRGLSSHFPLRLKGPNQESCSPMIPTRALFHTS